MRFLARLLLFALALAAAPITRAAITCSIASPGVAINYVNSTTTSVQTYFTVTCTRTSVSDPANVNYDVLADNGGFAVGQNNQAALGAARLRYDVYATSACNNTWKGNRKISDQIAWPNGATGTITKQTNFWVCILSAQTATSSGTYTDSIGMAMTYGGTGTAVGSIPIAIFAPALCTMVTPPGTIALNYTAFAPPVTQSTSFSVTCTSGMPYTIATDVPQAVLTGVRYTLGLNAASGNGTGALQTYSITATIPGGQAGSCPTASCTATRTHTLTISY